MAFTTPVQALERVASLAKSDRMPVLFLGHGSPMNAIGDNEYLRSWQALGAEFGSKFPRPQLIVCISAHWLTEGWWLTGMDSPKTIHDFGGFPQELFDQQYPAPGDAAAARAISQVVRQRASEPLGVDLSAWGLDHGTWSVLKPMFPEADIPVIQLSMDYSRAPEDHYALAQQLKGLRERGVLIVGSGNIVHNLRQMQRGAAGSQAYDWALEFDQTVGGYLQQGNLAALQNFQKLGTLAKMAHPTHEHYLPLLYAAGAVEAREPMRFFNTSFQGGSISMRSVVWG
ncbi:MAG: 4,5-DOPA dioxygenase extradiol [Polaromonas sp. 39-63-203]|jgi:4,5-DOPA dioxygenase extradiol|uniref:4,5-DOPA-extradiol-dioxygenase n=1 Tax=Polaromonas sp. TaxID=1869339 RepID=UPI000BC6D705|nr:4,5-DOPA dioxygenase extradiol [Polaromonas sp.]OYY53689.1 MAG: 4,5-DOPA dioxygenase extradiol [Polaromonas sp. 35-63-240]OYZ01567.1 MAG: 4,5-DOPA dioxygenase extradiol [Polaromonas sp. 28-63-22]OYZ84690.1 MAG: 4,5-DOPA dioxygenase extradiol [Polaromonas sp. 24-62-144]OZB01054.1 MAG: 4,5-DOPA dioxygenase extradiol [Polaromonas sp. 39-63-203]HQS31887.1 4,5-DOPA dioxygenase extradiol [Polaromonas sp.]